MLIQKGAMSESSGVSSVPQEIKKDPNPKLDFKFESDRFKSFEGYQSRECTITEELKANYARAGFYWTGNKEEVKCYFCHFRMLRLLHDETDPVKVHCTYNSTCLLMSRRPTQNVPIDETIMNTFLPPKLAFVVETGNIYGKYPEFRKYEERIKTFENWTSTCVEKGSLAKSGFFYLGNSDRVACFYCGLGLENFDNGDVPREEHLKFRRDCRFIEFNR